MERVMSLPSAPHSLLVDGSYRFGRYRGSIADVSMALSPLQRTRLKEWHYTSISTPRFFLAFGVV